MPGTHIHFSDPVEAYDRIAAHYGRIAERRSAYLQAVEDLVVAHIDPSGRSLLDVGAGNGVRAARIAARANLSEVVLLEPSPEMRKRIRLDAETWTLRAEELRPDAGGTRRFDVILCLWNVLGHISPESSRISVLNRLGCMLSPAGRLFLDVNHRYNVYRGGWLHVAARFANDRLRPSETNGNVRPRWEAGEVVISTAGRVFTDRELRRIAGRAGLRVERRVVVDYETGRIRRFPVEGSLLYALRRDCGEGS